MVKRLIIYEFRLRPLEEPISGSGLYDVPSGSDIAPCTCIKTATAQVYNIFNKIEFCLI